MKTRYKFLRTGLKSEYGDFTWEIGKWYKHNGKVSLCNGGFHCSKEIGQAFSYIQGEILAEVEVRGIYDKGDDKDSWEEMRIIKAWNWNKENSVAISIFSAELCLENYENVYPNEKTPRNAIEAAKKWLLEPTEENRLLVNAAARSARSATWSAARSAARSAAWSAARSAESAAWSAAESAESAAWSAARSAESAAESAESAESAAWSAARSATWSAESAARSAESAARSAARSATWSAARSAESAARSAARSAALKKMYKRFDEELTKLTKYDN